MQANEISQIPLKSKKQALNQCEAHVDVNFISITEFPRPVSCFLQTQLEEDYLQGYLYLPAIIQMIIGTITDTSKITPK